MNKKHTDTQEGKDLINTLGCACPFSTKEQKSVCVPKCLDFKILPPSDWNNDFYEKILEEIEKAKQELITEIRETLVAETTIGENTIKVFDEIVDEL